MTAVAIGFYEEIPTLKPARDDMPRWFQYSDVAQMRQVFSYQIGEQAYEDLVAYMAENQHRYQPRTLPADKP